MFDDHIQTSRAWALRALRIPPLALGVVAFVLACVLAKGGLLSSRYAGDVARYEDFCSRILHGQIPYHDFYVEYPPGALAAFLAPAPFGLSH